MRSPLWPGLVGDFQEGNRTAEEVSCDKGRGFVECAENVCVVCMCTERMTLCVHSMGVHSMYAENVCTSILYVCILPGRDWPRSGGLFLRKPGHYSDSTDRKERR